MKWIKYEYICGTNADGSNILAKKRIGYSDANIAIARTESYNGEYTIEDDGKEYPNEAVIPADTDMQGNRIKNLGAPTQSTDAARVLDIGLVIDDEVTLGLHTDGLIYLFRNGQPVGLGVVSGGGSDAPIIGYIDAETNNIVLSGELADGKYTFKYVDEDGVMTTIGTLEHNYEPSGPVEIPLTWMHGDVLNKTNGKVSDTGSSQYSASDFIGIDPAKTYTLTRDTHMRNTCNVCWYDANENFISYQDLGLTAGNASGNTGDLSRVLTPPSTAAKLRFRLWYEVIDGATAASYYKLIKG